MGDLMSTKFNGDEPTFMHLWQEAPVRKIKPLLEWGNPEIVPLRIGFCGEGSKRRVAKILAKELELPFIHDVAKTVGNIDIETMEMLMTTYFAQLCEEIRCPQFVSDTTVMDVLALLWRGLEKEKIQTSGLTNILSNFSSILAANSNHYTVVFYCPGPRKQMNRITKSILDNFGVDYWPLVGGQRRQQSIAMRYLESVGLLGREWDDDEGHPSED